MSDSDKRGRTGQQGARVPLDDADFRRMVETITEYAIFMLDPGGVIISWNAGAERLKGYRPEEAIGQHFSIFYPRELLDKDWPDHELAIARATGKYEEEGWRLRKDGTRFWASVTITRLAGADGQLRGFSKVTRDLTERQRQQQELRASEERFRLLVDGVKDYAIFMLDPSGHIASWNAGARATKGYEASEIIGQHFSIFYPPEVVATGFPAWELAQAKAIGRYEDEGWRVRKDGTRFWANVVITALHDEQGRHRGFAKVTRDLTERRKVTALEHEGRRIYQFLALLGHELRNPLAPIANAAELLVRADSSDGVKRMSAVIQRQVRQMTRLVDDLLDAGRIANGKIRLEMKPVSLAEVIGEAVEMMRPRADAKRQSLMVMLEEDGPVLGDRARLIQVVSNLLSNAIKFTPPQGSLSVTLTRSGAPPADAMEIRVRDNGQGITPGFLPRVFDIFEQGPQDLARSESGLGLGLTLVQQIVQMHQGEVLARSRGVPGEGAEFIVRLQPAPVSVEVEPDLPPLVLVADDNADSAETLQELVGLMGFRTAKAATGEQAIEQIRSLRPRVVLLDIGLPGIDGWEVARQAQAQASPVPALIAVTGYGQAADRSASASLGFHAHLTKPLDAAALEAAIRDALTAGP